MHKTYIYSDASFSNKHKLGVASYLILDSENSSQKLHSFSVKEKNNIRVEFIALIEALKTLKPKDNKEIIVYTDSRAIKDLLSRRKRLEYLDFKSKKTGNLLSNTYIYKEFFKIYDTYTPTIYWTKGHQAKKETIIEKNFSKVDKLARKTLKDLIKNII